RSPCDGAGRPWSGGCPSGSRSRADGCRGRRRACSDVSPSARSASVAHACPPDRAQWVKRYPHDGGDSVMGHDAVVMAGVDGSAPSLHALDWAAAHAAKVGWRLHIVCAYALPTFAAASLDGGYATLDDAAIRGGAPAVLDEALARVDDIGVPVTSALETGDP